MRAARLLITMCTISAVVYGAACLLVSSSFAQVMQSANYQIQFDSINVGGGLSSSGSYRLEDTTGEMGSGPSDSATYQVRAGYQQMNETYLSLSESANVTLLPALGGISGGEANGQTSVTVTTDSMAGYQLSIHASESPALVHTHAFGSFTDYVPAGAEPDFVFTFTSGQAIFGFSPEGADVAERFRDNGVICGTDTGNTADRCWDGLSTTSATIASRSNANHPLGTETVIKFRAGIGSNSVVPMGTYIATTTVTAIAL